MIQQFLSSAPSMNPMESDGTAKDPRNPQAVTILALPVLPLGWEAINAPDLTAMLLLGVPLVFFALSFAAILKGLADKARFDAAESARRPRVPFKIVGCVGLGLGAAAIVAIKDGTVVQCAQYGLAASVLAVLSFGLDPLRDKALDTAESRALHKVRRMVADLAARLALMQDEVDALGVPELSEEITDLGIAVSLLSDAACDDPTRVRGLRRHFGPIFDGVETATQSFARRYRSDPDQDALEQFQALVCEAQDEYYARARKFAQDGSTQLDVQTEVLRDMMKRA